MPDPNPNPDANKPPMSEEQIGDLVRKHLGGTLPKVLEAALAPHLTALREQLTPKAEPEKPKGAGAGAADDVATRFASLEGELKKEREARAAERTAAMHEKARNALRAEIAGNKAVRPEAVDDLTDLLFDARKAVRVGADGSTTFRLGDEDHDIKGGVAAFLKTPGAALYQAAPAPVRRGGLGGSPPRPAGGKPPVESPMDKTLRAIANLEAKTGQKVF